MTSPIDLAYVVHELRNALVPASVALMRADTDLAVVISGVTRALDLAAAIAAQDRTAVTPEAATRGAAMANVKLSERIPLDIVVREEVRSLEAANDALRLRITKAEDMLVTKSAELGERRLVTEAIRVERNDAMLRWHEMRDERDARPVITTEMAAAYVRVYDHTRPYASASDIELHDACWRALREHGKKATP